MMTKILCERVTMICAALIMLSGCSIRFPQVENIIHSLNDAPPAIDSYRWDLVSGFYHADVYAVSVNNGLVFASKRDDALLVSDGVIKRVVKIGNDKKLYEVFDEAVLNGQFKRSYWQDKVLMATHVCTAIETNVSVSEQVCRSETSTVEYMNRIKRDPQGLIVTIDQVYTAQGDRIVLQKKR